MLFPDSDVHILQPRVPLANTGLRCFHFPHKAIDLLAGAVEFPHDAARAQANPVNQGTHDRQARALVREHPEVHPLGDMHYSGELLAGDVEVTVAHLVQQAVRIARSVLADVPTEL